MLSPSRSDALKLLLYLAAAAAFGAWISPLFYNAGKALSEITSAKETNGLVEYLGNIGRRADFSWFQSLALITAAFVLFLPWMEFLAVARRARKNPGRTPWFLHLPETAHPGRPGGQPLTRRPRQWWEGCAAFLIAAGLMLPAAWAIVSGHAVKTGGPPPDFVAHIVRNLPLMIPAALALEFFFRGLAFGIFLRAFSALPAIAFSALFFAGAVAVFPTQRVPVSDPESSLPGFQLLENSLHTIFSPGRLAYEILPAFVLGLLLSFARWRTASLALPAGLMSALLIFRSFATTGTFPPAMIWLGLAVLAVISFTFTPRASRDAPAI